MRTQTKLEVVGSSAVTLGDVYEGSPVKREIVLRNTGKNAMRIDSVRTSCGCTSASVPSRTIRPGEKLKIPVTFDTNNLAGSFKRTVLIRPSDSPKDSIVVSFGMKIFPVIEVSPRYISFGRVKIGQAVTKTVRLQNDLREMVRILDCTVAESRLTVRLVTKVIRPGQSIELGVTLDPKSRGKLLGQIVVRTDQPLKPVIKISYVGQIRK